MARKLLSVEDFRSSAKDGDAPDAMIVCAISGTAEPVADSRRVKFVFSDGSIDRSGDMIDPKGWILDSFQKNPVALFGHDSSNVDSVIGRAVNVGAVGGKLVGEIDFAEADINPKADMAFKMVEAGILSAVSVGFMPIDYEFSTDKNRPYGIDFTKQELLEISLVPVPCNANALIQAKAMGLDGPLLEWVERALECDDKIAVPRKLLEETFKAAKTPRRVRRQYLEGEVSQVASEDQQQNIDANEVSAVVVEDTIKEVEDVLLKAGRKISAANQVLLNKAMDYHTQATDCIKQVMDSGSMMDDDGDEPMNQPMPPHDPMMTMAIDPVKAAEQERRLRYARAVKLAAESV